MRKRRPPVARTLIKNSKAAYLSAIEIHNKPIFSYRYEIVTILIINAWELLLKAYIYKFHKKVKVIKKDGTSKPFNKCLEFTKSILGKKFYSNYENLKVLYDYRNQFAHFYAEELNIIIFSLIKKNIEFYKDFLREHFDIEISKDSELVILPIGFKKPLSPFDYISNESVLRKAPYYIKNFITKIAEASSRLEEKDIDETILVNYRINLTNEKKVKNADIVAGVNNSIQVPLNFDVLTEKKKYILSEEDPGAIPVKIAKKKSDTKTTIAFPKLAEGIFSEINNVLDTNMLLSREEGDFIFSEDIYYRIYAERNHVEKSLENLKLLTEINLEKIYSPFLFWIDLLNEHDVEEIVKKYTYKSKYPMINNLIRLVTLLGIKNLNWLKEIFDKEYGKISQPPTYYFSLIKIRNNYKQTKSEICASIRKKMTSKINIEWRDQQYILKNLISDYKLSNKLLSEGCLRVFKGEKKYRNTVRILDVIANGKNILKKEIEL
ncbi:MAG: DUF3644 domain-containing protein [Atribacterota bacterium]